jgi:hypothetical protein
MRREHGLCLAAMTAAMMAALLGGGCGDDEPAAGSFGAECSSDADCDSGKCFEYGSKGKRCTEECPADPADCPNDGAGCNDKDVCKIE